MADEAGAGRLLGDLCRRPTPRPSGTRRQWIVTAAPFTSTSTPAGASARSRVGHLGHHRQPRRGGRGQSDRAVGSGLLHPVEADQAHPGRARRRVRRRGARPGRPAGRPDTTATTREPSGQTLEQVGHAVEGPGRGRVADDRGQGAVEVGDQRGRRRVDQERGEQGRRAGGRPDGSRPAGHGRVAQVPEAVVVGGRGSGQVRGHHHQHLGRADGADRRRRRVRQDRRRTAGGAWRPPPSPPPSGRPRSRRSTWPRWPWR